MSDTEDLGALALEKLTRVLGAERGARVHAEVLAATGVPSVRTPEDLRVFGETLAKRGGIEAAVGALLSVTAVLRGAERRSRGE